MALRLCLMQWPWAFWRVGLGPHVAICSASDGFRAVAGLLVGRAGFPVLID